MELLPFVAPVFPDKSAAVRLAAVEATGSGRSAFEASRRAAGISRESLWLQERPEGDLLLGVYEERRSGAVAALLAEAGGVLAPDLVGSITGRDDVAQAVRLVHYRNHSVHGRERIAFVLRRRRGAGEATRHFAATIMGLHALEHDAARRRWGVACEQLWEMDTAEGELSFFYLEADDVAATLRAAALSQDAYDIWWRERLADTHDVDLSALRRALPARLILDWTAPRESDLRGLRASPRTRRTTVPAD